MRIFKFKDGELLINKDEIFLHSPFREIMSRDKLVGKPIAWAELKFIYFVADTDAIPYKRGSDENQSIQYAMDNCNLPKGWMPDKVVEDAITIYKEENLNVIGSTVREIIMIFGNYATIIRKLRYSINEMLKKDKLTTEEARELINMLTGVTNVATNIPEIKGKLFKVIKELELVESKDVNFIRGMGEIVPQSANPEEDY